MSCKDLSLEKKQGEKNVSSGKKTRGAIYASPLEMKGRLFQNLVHPQEEGQEWRDIWFLWLISFPEVIICVIWIEILGYAYAWIDIPVSFPGTKCNAIKVK